MIELFIWVIGGVKCITPDGWIAFLGSILGFLGVFITIKYTKKQFREEKRIEIKPYLSFIVDHKKTDEKLFGYLQNRKIEKNDSYIPKTIFIASKNIGMGNCLNCKLLNINFKKDSIIQIDENGYIGHIEVGEESINFGIILNYEYGREIKKIKNEIKDKLFTTNINELEDKINKRYDKDKIELIFEYTDVFENKYRKSIFIYWYPKYKLLKGGQVTLTELICRYSWEYDKEILIKKS